VDADAVANPSRKKDINAIEFSLAIRTSFLVSDYESEPSSRAFILQDLVSQMRRRGETHRWGRPASWHDGIGPARPIRFLAIEATGRNGPFAADRERESPRTDYEPRKVT
jgi:hypothetical protein